MRNFTVLLALLTFAAFPARAGVLEVVPVAEGVYALVGPLGQRNPGNFGDNATFGAVVTHDGVVLIDSGGSAKGAALIDDALKGITDKPVITVIDTGGQDHRWLGNGYFKAKGAKIIASSAAVADQTARSNDELTMMGMLIGDDNLAGTETVTAEHTFSDRLDVTIGGVRFVLRKVGPAHTPGDTLVWLPDAKVAFAGDVVFLERILGVQSYSNSKGWVAAYKALAALNPAVVVPGHGHPAPLAAARAQTYDYLVNLRSRIGKVLANGGAIEDGIAVDQSAFKNLNNFDALARRNAQAVYMEMEFQ